jgi:hypothetical protein
MFLFSTALNLGVTQMFKKLGWAALLVAFIAAPATAQGLLDGVAGEGGHGCGFAGPGGLGVGHNNCDGQLVNITDNIADAVATAIITVDVIIEVEVDELGNFWPGFKPEDVSYAVGINPDANLIGNRGLNAQDLIDAENAIGNMEVLADRAIGVAQQQEIERNIACAGVPLSLRYVLCPKIL